jgi:hypothetical protein
MKTSPPGHAPNAKFYRRLRAIVDRPWGRARGRELIMIKIVQNLSPMREMPHLARRQTKRAGP